MRLVPIFVSHNSDEGIWSIQLDGNSVNEFERFFDLANDVKRLYSFFDENVNDLNDSFFRNISIGAAISRTLEEAGEMEDSLYEYSEHGFDGNERNLQHLFKPLNNFEYAIASHQKSKTRIRTGWLRLYAIRIAKNCYVVTGGAIKLTHDMKRDHLQRELGKLEQTKQFLRKNGIEYPEDLNTTKDE